MPDDTSPGTLAAVVRERIAAAGDPDRAPQMQRYMKSAMPYRGVTAPVLSRLLREAYAEHPLPDEESWHAAVRLLWDDAQFREERYAATTLAQHRRYREHRQPHTLDLYRHLVVTGAWWDHVDDVATHLVREVLVRDRAAVTPVLRSWADEDDLWLRRTAIICQVGLKDDVDRDFLVAALDANLDGSTRTTPPKSPYGREFFVRKAIGWALRDHARTDPAWVQEYVAARGARLSGLSRREALKHLGAGST